MALDWLECMGSIYAPKACSSFGSFSRIGSSFGSASSFARHTDFGCRDSGFYQPPRFEQPFRIEKVPSSMFGAYCSSLKTYMFQWQQGILPQKKDDETRESVLFAYQLSFMEKVKESRLFEAKIELGNIKFNFSEKSEKNLYRETRLLTILSSPYKI